MWVRLQEAYGENKSWNAEKQTNKTYKLTPHKTNKQKAEQRIQKLPTVEEEFKVCIPPNDRALVSTSSFQLRTQKSHILGLRDST